MKPPAKAKQFPAWLRFVGWLAFSGLALVSVLVVARWWVMRSGHQRAMELVMHSRRVQPVSKQRGLAGEAALPKPAELVVARGTPVVELPLVGIYLGGDSPEHTELLKALEEMKKFLTNSMLRESRVDGVLGFRTLLAKMGLNVPESMTEEEAAAVFLKQAGRFSDLLAQWHEAVGKGPWDCSTVDVRTGALVGMLPRDFQNLLGTMVEARLRLGDRAAAWSDWETMRLGAERCGDLPLLINGMFRANIRAQMFQAARAGMELGAWTDDQLARISSTLSQESALASMRRDLEGEKLSATDYFTHFNENRNDYMASLNGSDSLVPFVVNRIGISLTTDQQIADNLAVILNRMDQPLTRFDPDTGIYLGESPEDAAELPHSKPFDISFDKFYFMYSEMYGGAFYDYLPRGIIKNQSTIDQSRLAAALEIHHRATGEYPESLDAVSATFSGTMPRDIATGQPYLYQRDANGGYKLWGTGIDGKSDGGDEDNDVTWTHRPVKAK